MPTAFKLLIGFCLALASGGIACLVAVQPTWAVTSPTPTPIASLAPSANESPSPGDADLKQEKTREEVRKLQIENDRADSWFGLALAAAPFITAIVAILTLGLAARNNRTEATRQRRADREQRAAELGQRADEIFTDAIKNLSSTEDGLRAAGAASMLRLSDNANPSLQREILVYTAAQLRLGISENVRPIIREVFERAISVVFAKDAPEATHDLSLEKANLTRTRLRELSLRRAHLNLSEADLTDADLYETDMWSVKAPRATFRRADCRRVNFGPADLRGTNFQQARMAGSQLASAKLHGADVSGANFQGAKLQSTHFDGAVLNGVNFSFADVKDAYFTNATMDQATIDSLRTAKNTDKAHPPQAQPTQPVGS